MTVLPDFLGIGAPRCGTTWLHRILGSHPQVFVPEHRKELAFFCGRNLHRGAQWYSEFFSAARPDQIAGEITPAYLRTPEAPQRILKMLPSCKFLVMVRNPVDRTFSHYTRQMMQKRSVSFEDWLAGRSGAINAGLYASQLRRYLDVFDISQFLVIVLEQAVRAPDQLGKNLGGFLDVDAAGFDLADVRAENKSRNIRFPKIFGSLRRGSQRLRALGFDAVVDTAKRTPLIRVFDGPSPVPRLDAATRARLWPQFENDTKDLEAITGLDLAEWRPDSGHFTGSQ